MQSIGERLEEARKRKGISIREAAEATKIRGEYLHKFESNQYDIRLPEIYVRGFLRSYSNFLKLPADKIIADYNALHQGETKSSRSMSREVYGRMDISTSKEKDQAAANAAGTTPPVVADAAHPGEPAAVRNPATFVPPHSTGSPIDKKLIVKIAAIASALVLVIILIVMLASGRSGSPTPHAPRETWVTAQPGEPTITIAAKTIPVEVRVTSQTPQQGGAVTTYYQGTIPAGESRILPRREALRVESAQYNGVQFIIDGRPWPMTAAAVNINAP